MQNGRDQSQFSMQIGVRTKTNRNSVCKYNNNAILLVTILAGPAYFAQQLVGNESDLVGFKGQKTCPIYSVKKAI